MDTKNRFLNDFLSQRTRSRSLDEEKLDEWLQKHKQNLMLESPIELDEEEMTDEEQFYEHEIDNVDWFDKTESKVIQIWAH